MKKLSSPGQSDSAAIGVALGTGNLPTVQTAAARKQPSPTQRLQGATSVIIPCRNEEQNIAAVVHVVLRYIGEYVQEIVIVNDNSTDSTERIALDLGSLDARIKVVNCQSPGGVGPALRQGVAAAHGRYILTMDADFIAVVPEFPKLFDAVASGADGAVGSRFSEDSVLVGYPFSKYLCNRAFHMLVRLVLIPRIRDVTNNLKLYRSEIFKTLDIQSRMFAANAETGLMPLLRGYVIQEVPISWFSRTKDMGYSHFKLLSAGPEYCIALWRMFWREKVKIGVRSYPYHQ